MAIDRSLLMLSGGITPRQSMPGIVQNIMLAAPATYFVRLAQGILYRSACFFTIALFRFRKSVTQTQV